MSNHHGKVDFTKRFIVVAHGGSDVVKGPEMEGHMAHGGSESAVLRYNAV